MRQELQDLGVTFVKFWASWYELAEDLCDIGETPSSFEEMAQFMDTKPLIHYLDENIKAAQDDGLAVILGVYQDAPTWSSGATAPESGGRNRPAKQKLPTSHTVNSPYGWFIRYLVARYTGDDSEGPGSGCVTKTGNPLRARINAIEPVNELNYEWWPQANGLPVAAARDAMMTCEWWCRFYQPNYGYFPWMYAPGTSDRDGSSAEQMDYEDFTAEVLVELQGWPTIAPVRWSHHNYADIRERKSTDESRVANVHWYLFWYGFGEHSSDPGWVDMFLTEGASKISHYYDVVINPATLEVDEAATLAAREGKEDIQAEDIRVSLEQMRLAPYVRIWTQHTLRDGFPTGDDLSYGFRNAGEPGAVRDAWDKFKNG